MKKKLMIVVAAVIILLGVVFAVYRPQMTLNHPNQSKSSTNDDGYLPDGDFCEDMLLVKSKKTKKYGFVNREYQLIIATQYDHATEFRDGIAIVEQNGKWGLIDKTGKFIVEPKYDCINYFKEGFAAVEFNGKWGYIDKTGNCVIEPRFSAVFDFIGELAYVKINGCYGIINKNGQIIIKPVFTQAQTGGFLTGNTVLKVGSKWFYINNKEKLTIGTHIGNDCQFDNGWLDMAEKGKWGLIRQDGSIIVKPELDDKAYSNFYSFSALIKSGTKWVCYDSGKPEISLQAKIPEKYYCNDRAMVIINGKLGFVDRQERVVVQPEYEEARNFEKGLAAVCSKGKWGFVDKNGKMVIRLNKATVTTGFRKGHAIIEENEKYRFIDKHGVISKEVYDEIDYPGFILEDIGMVKQNGKYGFVDSSGKVVIPIKYNAALECTHGIVAVNEKGKWGIFDFEGRMIIKPKFEDAVIDDGVKVLKKGKLYWVDLNGRLTPDNGD
jgi:hypothetical protein